jgi:serine phosphatase RsbU (regulator of sigma subunit)
LFDKIKTNHFMSSVMLRWDNEKQKMFFTWAWHETIIHYSKETWKINNIKTWWIAIKMVKDVSKLINEKSIDFKEWDCLVIYSDWITEAKNQKDERYWLQRFTEILEKNGSYWSQLIFENFTEDFAKFVWPSSQDDDITFILLKNIGQYWWNPIMNIWSTKDNDKWISATEWSWWS